MSEHGGIRRDNDRSFLTQQRLDWRRSPPAYVDEELPTNSVVIRVGRGGPMRAPHGTQVGSYRITGSFEPLTAPGTFSFRVTRLSVFAGTPGARFFVRHSRGGTQDLVFFPTPGQETRLAGPLNPIYAFGPGSIIAGFLADSGGGMGSAYWMGWSLEGYPS